MTDAADDRSPLDDRKAAILCAVVQEYIETAQPVGSSAAARGAALEVSSATVRNDMASLEAAGYLLQPHTSAGRVPSDKGYRFFVDTIERARLQPGERRQVSEFFMGMRGEIEDLVRSTAGLLSGITDYAAVVVDAGDDRAEVRSFQLVWLGDRQALAVEVLSTGAVHKQTLEWDRDASADEVERASAALRAAHERRPYGQPGVVTPTGETTIDALVDQAARGLVATDEPERVYIDGTSKVVDSFDAIETVSTVLSILEQQLVVVSLLSDVVDRGLDVAIGNETGLEPLADASIVVAPYEVDGSPAGSIAVLGPTRMNYPQAMAAVAVVSRQLSQRLTEG